MSLKKATAILAAAGALAAISVPAMAFENEFHGFYQIKGFLSNFNNGAVADQSPTVLKKHERSNNYFEQRARIFYTGKASDDLKLVTAFEIDTRFGGMNDGKYSNTTDSGTLDADGVNMETKWVYLDFNATKNVNVKTGVMPYKDSLKGLFIDADVPALYTTTKLGAFTLGLGYTRYKDLDQANNKSNFSNGHLGDATTDLVLLDTSYAISKDIKAGLSYYFLHDNAGQYSFNKMNDGTSIPGAAAATAGEKDFFLHTFGLNAEAKLGAVTVSGVAAMQAGVAKQALGTGKNMNFHGYALNAAAKMPIGPGTVKTAILYTSGDENSDGQYNGWVGSGVQSYNESGMMLLVRNNATSGTTNTNEFVRRTISNVALYTLGYDAKITPKAYANANVGFAWAAKNAGAPVDKAENNHNGSNYMGSEIAIEGGYKVFDNLTASLQASYLILGGYYKGAAADSTAASAKDPENPYTTRIVLTYAF